MKIKYSNKVKRNLSLETIQELFLLSCSIAPHPTQHIFTFDKTSKGNICITHFILETNFYSQIIFKPTTSRTIPKEPVIILDYGDCSYIVMSSELQF